MSAAESNMPAVSPVVSEKTTDTRALLKDLQARFDVFRQHSPLAIGIDKQLFTALPDLSKKSIRLAMRSHTMTTRYLREMEKASHRLNLDGSQAGEVTDENRQHAAELLKERFKKQAEQRKAQEAAAKAEVLKQKKLLELTEKFGRKSG
jgi:ProP effector